MPTVHNASTYGNHGCRCDECRAAHAEAMRTDKANRVARLAADPTLATHGKATTYTNWGCRCDLCRDAHAAYYRGLYASRRGQS